MAVVQPPPNNTNKPRTFSTADLLSQKGREFIMLVGKDGVGKTCAIVSLAKWVQVAIDPAATFFVIDTENKFGTAIRSFGADAPTNLVYYKCDNIDEVCEAVDDIMSRRKPGDWIACESMSRIWEKAQDKGYKLISGYEKDEYLEKRRAQKSMPNVQQAPPIPQADKFWNIVKDLHDARFVDRLDQASTLNVVWSTIVSKPPKADAFIKENATRKEVRAEFGIDIGIDGAPRIPYHVETLCLFDLQGGKVTCRILRDDSATPTSVPRPTFEVPDKTSWAMQFYMTCRG